MRAFYESQTVKSTPQPCKSTVREADASRPLGYAGTARKPSAIRPEGNEKESARLLQRKARAAPAKVLCKNGLEMRSVHHEIAPIRRSHGPASRISGFAELPSRYIGLPVASFNPINLISRPFLHTTRKTPQRMRSGTSHVGRVRNETTSRTQPKASRRCGRTAGWHRARAQPRNRASTSPHGRPRTAGRQRQPNRPAWHQAPRLPR